MKKNSIVGPYIKSKRTELGLSQKALGQAFEPPVTTQFVSNIERGATPLPPTHIGKICQVLRIKEEELLQMMEKEYASKLTHKVGLQIDFSPGGIPIPSWLRKLVESYPSASPEVQQMLKEACERILSSIKD